MKRILILLFLSVCGISLLGCSRISNRKAATPLNSEGESHPNRFDIDTGSLSLQSTMKNVDGDTIDIYTDDQYHYFIRRDSNECDIISLSDEYMGALGQKYEDNPESLVTPDMAEKYMLQAVALYFPEYNDSSLKYTMNEIETGSYIEYYTFSICEYDGENRVNTAGISIAFDGTVSLVSGTHNSSDLFIGSDVFNSDEILDMVYNYVLKEADNKAKSVYPEDEAMPKYQLIIASKDDLKDVTLEKIIYEGKPCWKAEFTLLSSWSEIVESEVTDPIFNIYVDAISGEVISYNYT